MRVAVVTTHPIQYQVPWLQLLAARQEVDLKVFFAMLPDNAELGREFGVEFAWDLPLLEGYEYQVLENVSRRPTLTSFSGCDSPQIYREIREGRFDAVIVNGWVVKTCLQALLACRISRTPCIVRGEANGLRPRPLWKRWLHRVLIAQYSAILSIGTNNRRYYLDQGVPDSRIFPTPYCVDNDRFRTAAEAWNREPGGDALRARFGLAKDCPTFLFSGKFVDKKRPVDIIDAVQKLMSEGAVNLQVLMVGDGPLRDELHKRSRGLPIRFTGFLNQAEISAAYAVADCLVLPSDHGETWGLVVNEAMACGLPAVVSSQVGSAVDLVTPGVTGEIFPCGDVAALASIMGRCSREPRQLFEMGQQAQARVCNDYNFARVVSGAMAALRTVIKEAG